MINDQLTNDQIDKPANSCKVSGGAGRINPEPATSNQQPVTSNQKQATSNQQPE